MVIHNKDSFLDGGRLLRLVGSLLMAMRPNYFRVHDLVVLSSVCKWYRQDTCVPWPRWLCNSSTPPIAWARYFMMPTPIPDRFSLFASNPTPLSWMVISRKSFSLFNRTV